MFKPHTVNATSGQPHPQPVLRFSSTPLLGSALTSIPFQAAWDQLKDAFAAIDDAQTKAAALAPHLQTIWREHPDLKQLHRLRVEDNLKAIAYMADDVRRFKEQDLGTPRPVAVRAWLEDEEL